MTTESTFAERESMEAMKTLVCGSGAGFMGKLVEYPFDTVKVLLQTQSLNPPQYRGPVDCLTQCLRAEGVAGLYRGITSPLIGAVLENAILFAGYGYLQKGVRFACGVPEKEALHLGHLAMAGALAGTLAAVVLTPVELVKCRMQTRSGIMQGQGPLRLALSLWKTTGLRGMYIGHSATTIRETGGGAAWFGVYEATCKAMLPRGVSDKSSLGPGKLMLSGALAGMAYNAVLFPVDTVKSRAQTIISTPEAPRPGLWRIGRQIWAQEGIHGLYRGMGVTLVRSVPGSAMIFLTYEMLYRYLSA